MAALVTATGFAQTEKSKTQTENIIIRKNSGDKNEKLTIVVDGDKVTVNGKPVEELNDESVTITRSNIPRVPRPPRAPKAPRSGFQAYDIATNKALLGVSTRQHEKGAAIQSVSEGSAADKAGLKEGDIIIKLNDDEIKNPSDLYKAVGKYEPEEKVKVTYLRDGKEDKTKAVLGKASTQSIWSNGDFVLNIPEIAELQELDELRSVPGVENFTYNWQPKPKVGLQIEDLQEGAGVKVTDVNNDAPAAKAGLQKDDVITAVDGQEIKSVDELKAKLKNYKEGDAFNVTYKRDNATLTANIKLPKKVKKASI